MADATSLRAVADALTIFYDLDPRPSIDEGYSGDFADWLTRYSAAAADLAEEAAGDSIALRAAHGPAWDSDDERPLELGLLVSAALVIEEGTRR